ncbi:hypothetical protein BDA99DRAFT_502542 [Phascolomyces articulosus]|uniref:C2H2-type domain-containing protein n=1 Tax=Phascolomyces articulosus TaxID=60185 RepID=A0AAD5PGS1_9FUNG|nr:hypothetical protein BDA99DRAFT_502542 [Phascolomyces articulosus]
MVILGVASPEETSGQQENQPQQRSSTPRHDASISALLNDKQTQNHHHLQQQHHHHEDYLPTPVTPATNFPSLSSSSTKTITRPSDVSTTTTATKTTTTASPLPSPLPSTTVKPSIPSPTVVLNEHSAVQQQQRRTSSSEKISAPTTLVDKPYACTHCNQTFSRPHNLKSHLTTHSSERPFQVSDIYSNFLLGEKEKERERERKKEWGRGRGRGSEFKGAAALYFGGKEIARGDFYRGEKTIRKRCK